VASSDGLGSLRISSDAATYTDNFFCVDGCPVNLEDVEDAALSGNGSGERRLRRSTSGGSSSRNTRRTSGGLDGNGVWHTKHYDEKLSAIENEKKGHVNAGSAIVPAGVLALAISVCAWFSYAHNHGPSTDKLRYSTSKIRKSPL
jgi:hypothetical protein